MLNNAAGRESVWMVPFLTINGSSSCTNWLPNPDPAPASARAANEIGTTHRWPRDGGVWPEMGSGVIVAASRSRGCAKGCGIVKRARSGEPRAGPGHRSRPENPAGLPLAKSNGAESDRAQLDLSNLT